VNNNNNNNNNYDDLYGAVTQPYRYKGESNWSLLSACPSASACICQSLPEYCLRRSFFLWSALFQSVGTTRLSTPRKKPSV